MQSTRMMTFIISYYTYYSDDDNEYDYDRSGRETYNNIYAAFSP